MVKRESCILGLFLLLNWNSGGDTIFRLTILYSFFCVHAWIPLCILLCSCVTFTHLFRSHKSATVYHYYIGVVCLFYLSHSWSYILLSFPCLLVVVVRALGLDFILYFISLALGKSYTWSLAQSPYQ